MSLRHAALGLLAREPGSGYDLLKKFKSSLRTVWPATQSQLYGELNKLAASGLISVSDVGPRGRKEYAITDAGRDELHRWMTSPEEDPPIRSSVMLRVFLLGELTAEQARQYVQSLRDFVEEELKSNEQTRDTKEWTDSDSDFFARSALDYIMSSAERDYEWANSLLDQLDRRIAARGPGKSAS